VSGFVGRSRIGMGRAVKKLLVGFLVLVLLAGAGACVLYTRYVSFLETPLLVEGEERVFKIPRGASAADIVALFEEAGVIRQPMMMRWLLYRSSLSRRLQPGVIVLTPDMRPEDLVMALARVGKYARRTVSVQSGMNLYELATRLHEQRMADRQHFLETALSPFFASEAGVPATGFEGYLAAGTYTFGMEASAEEMLREMHAGWREMWHGLVAEHRGVYEAYLRQGWDDHRLLTLASMIEKEAVVNGERPIIARVFLNRLNKKMRLQSDPTCVYPPLADGEKPTPKRCKDTGNAYSTYVIPGLPPGPITTVSEASMRAVFEPYSGPDAKELLFFVARQDGSWRHYFSKTYAEHQVAVDHFLKGKAKKPRGTVQPKF